MCTRLLHKGHFWCLIQKTKYNQPCWRENCQLRKLLPRPEFKPVTSLPQVSLHLATSCQGHCGSSFGSSCWIHLFVVITIPNNLGYRVPVVLIKKSVDISWTVCDWIVFCLFLTLFWMQKIADFCVSPSCHTAWSRFFCANKFVCTLCMLSRDALAALPAWWSVLISFVGCDDSTWHILWMVILPSLVTVFVSAGVSSSNDRIWHMWHIRCVLDTTGGFLSSGVSVHVRMMLSKGVLTPTSVATFASCCFFSAWSLRLRMVWSVQFLSVDSFLFKMHTAYACFPVSVLISAVSFLLLM